jgi:hypothetical protein
MILQTAGIPLVFLCIAWVSDIEASAGSPRAGLHMWDCCLLRVLLPVYLLWVLPIMSTTHSGAGSKTYTVLAEPSCGRSFHTLHFTHVLQARTVWHRGQLEKLNSMGPGAQYAATGQPVRRATDGRHHARLLKQELLPLGEWE